MTQLNKKRFAVVVTICCAVLFFYSLHVHAAQSGKAITPELLQLALNAAGIKAEIVPLDGDGGFEKGVLIKNLKGSAVLIGFPKEGIQREKPFLLSIEGKDSMVKLADSGGIVVLNGDATFYEDADFQTLSTTGCIIDAVGSMVDDILSCHGNPFCIVGAVFSGVGDILGCL